MTTPVATSPATAAPPRSARRSPAAAGALAVLWAMLVLPPQVLVWSGRQGALGWVVAVYDALGYAGLERWLAGLGLDDAYMLFGIAVVPSVLLAWWAMRPALLALGGPGRVLDGMWLALAPLVALSYLNHPPDAPLHGLWGGEAFLLLVIFAWSPVAALLARRRGLPRRVLVLVAATGLVGVLATLVAGYWPHSTMLGIGVEAALLARWYPPRGGSGTLVAAAHR